jgi:hypothetical protein
MTRVRDDCLSLPDAWLAECEYKGLHTRVKKFDLDSAIVYLPLLPDELVETRLANLAGPVRGRIKASIVAWRGAVQFDSIANRLPVLRRTEHQMEIAGVEPKHDRAGGCLEHGALATDDPRPTQSPLIQCWLRRRGVALS